MKRVSPFYGVLLALLTWPRVAPCADAQQPVPVAYFDNVSSVTSAPADFYVDIPSVQEGFPAEKAGILRGDHVIGLDGFRVRNYFEYQFLRRFLDQRPTLPLTVVRQGRIISINIPDPKPIRRGGFGMEGHSPVFATALAGWNIPVVDLLPVPPPQIVATRTNDLTQLLFEAFMGNNSDAIPMTMSDSLTALNFFPARGQEAIIRLMATNSDADRQWIVGLLKVYGCLLFEKYDEAAQIITSGKLMERKPDLFLYNLLQFYQRLIAHRVSAGNGVRLDDYGVDIPFFALCFPYPVSPDPQTNAFPSDPAFQEFFAKATSGEAVYKRFQDELSQVAYQYATRRSSDDAETYIGQVKASVLDLKNHGGWPCRSSLIWSKEQSAEMVKVLLARLTERPDERAEIALSLLAPAVIAGDESAFRTACEMNLQCGPRQSALARLILRNTLRIRGNATPARYREIMDSVETVAREPAIYAYLNKVSPAFACRYSLGRSFFVEDRHSVEGMSTYCFVTPFVVAKALQKPVMWKRLESRTDIALQEDDPEILADTLELLKFGLAFNPQPRLFDNLIKLRLRVGAGKVFDALLYAVAYHDVLWREAGLSIRIPDVYSRFFGDVETQYYGEVATALGKMDNKDPALPQKISELYAKAGVPSVCLLLSRKLKEAGNTDLAEHYLRLAVDFWDAMAAGYGTPYASTWACRDLASTPGFEDTFRRYAGQVVAAQDRKTGRATDSGYVLAAVVESYLGDYDSAVRDLILSVGPNLQKMDGPFLYKGEVFASCDYLRTELLTDLLKSNKLSEAQMAQLETAPGQNVRKQQEFVQNAIDKADAAQKDAGAQRAAAQSLRLTGRHMKAAAYYRRSLAIDDQTSTRWDLAYVLTAAKQHKDAIVEYQTLLGREISNPERDSAIKAIAESYDALGDTKQTLAFLTSKLGEINTTIVKKWANARIKTLSEKAP